MGERIDYIERTRAQYESLGYPPYKWVNNRKPPAFKPLTKPLANSRVGLVCSGGIYRVGQTAFHFKDDFSYRVVDTRTPKQNLRITHFAYDLTDARLDPNVVYPVPALRALERANVINELARNSYTFMGGIYSARKVREALAPAIVNAMVRDEVDVAVLVPV